MEIGVPREIKPDENRVALTPGGVAALAESGHHVLVETGAGTGSSLPDALYTAAGAQIVPDAASVWQNSELVLKVKEPIESEFGFLRSDLALFTYLHLAANEPLTRALVDAGTAALAYETLQQEDGSLPLLAPMSEVAGRLAVQVGAWCLERQNGGRGLLLSGAAGVRPGKVVILGAGIAGTAACQVAVGMGADVSILDIDPSRLRYVNDILSGHITTVMSNRANLEEEIPAADLVLSTVLIPGARAPKLLTRDLVASMKSGAAVVDVAIDQGGTAETSRPTTHRDPIYRERDVVHYCVTNMPAIVPHTSTHALTNATLSYAQPLADRGVEGALGESRLLRTALNIGRGRIVHPAVAAAWEELGTT